MPAGRPPVRVLFFVFIETGGGQGAMGGGGSTCALLPGLILFLYGVLGCVRQGAGAPAAPASNPL